VSVLRSALKRVRPPLLRATTQLYRG